MLNLPQKTLDHIKKFLLRQRRQIEGNLKSVEKDDPATVPALAETVEPGTEAWIASEHSRTVAMVEQMKKLSFSIGKALNKIRQGTYGHCEKCQKHIETSRLLAMPTAAYCVVCSKKVSR